MEILQAFRSELSSELTGKTVYLCVSKTKNIISNFYDALVPTKVYNDTVKRPCTCYHAPFHTKARGTNIGRVRAASCRSCHRFRRGRAASALPRVGIFSIPSEHLSEKIQLDENRGSSVIDG